MTERRSPADPYAPPDADVQRAMPVAHAPGKALAVIYGAAAGGNLLARAIALFGPYSAYRIASWVTSVLGVAMIVVALAWLYAAWKGLPESHRGTVTPRRAALSILVPLYGVYWALAVNLALCATLDGILARSREDRRAPRTLGIVAWAAWLGSFVLGAAITAAHRPVPLFPLVVPALTGGLWLAYMVRCDQARDAVARLGDDPARLGAPRLSPIQRERGPGVLAAIGLGLFIVLGLACWQVLAPDERPPSHDAAPAAT